MKHALLIISAAFSVTLAIILGLRISADALAVIVGVILGVLAGVPTTLLVVFVFMRRQSHAEQSRYPAAQHPPVVVINTNDKPPGGSPAALPPPYPLSGTRKWTVVGDEETGSPGTEG